MNERLTTTPYDYSQGLTVTEHFYTNDKAHHKTTQLSAEAISMPRGEQRQALAAKTDEALANRYVEHDQSTGSSLEFVIVNNDSPENDIEVLHLQWHTAVRDPGIRPLLMALAMQGSRRMVVSSVGMGDSAPLRPETAKHIAKTGSFIPYQEDHLAIYERVLADYDRVTLGGESEGARRALALAALFTHAKTLTMIDPPGSRKLGGVIGLGRAFMIQEGKHIKRYTKTAQDPELQAAQVAQDKPQRLVKSFRQLRQRGSLMDTLLRETKAMSHDGLQADAEQALPNVAERFSFVAPDQSALNDAADILTLAQNLAKSREELAQPLISVLTFPGTHSFGAANMPVTAALYRQADQPPAA